MFERCFVGNAGICPDFESGVVLMDAADALKVVAASLDGIEVGDIQGSKRMKFEQGFDDFRWLRAGAQPRADWPVFFAPAFAGMDYHSTLEVDDGNQVETGHG